MPEDSPDATFQVVVNHLFSVVGRHYVSLDKVLHTMRETGRDMMDKYKETARGGLAVNIIEC